MHGPSRNKNTDLNAMSFLQTLFDDWGKDTNSLTPYGVLDSSSNENQSFFIHLSKITGTEPTARRVIVEARIRRCGEVAIDQSL
jgi:hypothetical protein